MLLEHRANSRMVFQGQQCGVHSIRDAREGLGGGQREGHDASQYVDQPPNHPQNSGNSKRDGAHSNLQGYKLFAAQNLHMS